MAGIRPESYRALPSGISHCTGNLGDFPTNTVGLLRARIAGSRATEAAELRSR